MVNDTDLSHQPDAPQQPPVMKKKSNPIWKIIFIPLFIVNLIYLLFTFYTILTDVGSESGWGIFGMFLLGFPLSIIDIIVVLFYITKQNPQGIAKVISYTALALVSLVLVFSGFAFITLIPGPSHLLYTISLYFQNSYYSMTH